MLRDLRIMGLLLGVVFCQQVYAGGLEGAGLGTRQLSMGGAFIGLADDWTAIYWNPAGLARLKERGGGLSLDYVTSRVSDGNSVANPPIDQINKTQGDLFFQHPLIGPEPTFCDKKEIELAVYLPAVGGYTEFRGWSLGGGMYTPAGYSAKWEDTKQGIDASFEMKAFEVVYNLSGAKKIKENLFLGLGLNILQGSSKMETKKVVPGSYTYTSKADGDGLGIEEVIGVLYQPRPNLSAGLVYRTGSNLDLDGSAKISYPFPIGPPPNWAMFVEESDYEQVFKVPTTYGLGIAYNPFPKLILTSDLTRTDWTTFRKEIDFTKPDQNLLKDKDESLDWKAVSKVRLGAEYKYSDSLAFRAGLFTDPSPVPDKAVSMTNLGGVDVNRNLYTIGLGKNLKDWQIDLGFLHTKADREAQGVKYEKEANSFHIALSSLF
ncbi:MAG: outer membrane protein transport protein [Candidatus Desantisbacteria bacterium]